MLAGLDLEQRLDPLVGRSGLLCCVRVYVYVEMKVMEWRIKLMIYLNKCVEVEGASVRAC